jgi:uncharacterized protein (DUF58 family)
VRRNRGRPARRIEARRAVGVIAAGLALALIAFVFDAAPLFVVAVALVLLGVLTPAWVALAAQGLHAERLVTVERVVEQQPLEATIELRRGWFGAPGAELSDQGSGQRIALSESLSPLHGAPAAQVRVISRFSRRGLQRLAPATIVVRDPLELARVKVGVTGGPDQLLVLPATERVRWAGPEHQRRLALREGPAGSESLAAADLDGLRPYRPGAPASRIYWPAVARGAGLIERRLRADGDSRPLVVLDTRCAAPADDVRVDEAVRAAASIALDLARAGGCGLLLPGEQRPTMIDRELAAWPAAHARLAVVTSGLDARPPGVASLAGRAGPMIYVTPEPAQRAASLRALSGSAPAILVIPAAALVSDRPPGHPGATPALSVSGCRGFSVRAGRASGRPRPHSIPT